MRRPLVILIMLGALAAPGIAQADVVSDWNAIAQAETVLLRPTAHGQARGMAMAAGAMYDAVNAIDRGYQPYLVDLDVVDAPEWASIDAAAATAAYRVLLAITPAARHGGLDDAYTATLLVIPDGPMEDEGVAAGEAAAAAMLLDRQGDGFMAPFTPTIGTEAGDWRPLGWPLTPAFDPDGWVANLKPFLIESPSQFRAPGPPELTSGDYAADFNEVKELGAVNSTTRTPDQTAAAVFWQAAPIALYNPLARSLAGRFGLDSADRARLYAEINLVGADAPTACWESKYYFNFWRPRAAIREADTDGNSATIADPSWEALFTPTTATAPAINTPPFPDYPSGHGCLSGAVLTMMADVFGHGTIDDGAVAGFDIVSSRSLNGTPIPPRHFERFSQVLNEIVDARVWGGIHFRTADVHGAVLGKKLAHWVQRRYFQPLN
jgi:PAP2 superfamily